MVTYIRHDVCDVKMKEKDWQQLESTSMYVTSRLPDLEDKSVSMSKIRRKPDYAKDRAINMANLIAKQ